LHIFQNFQGLTKIVDADEFCLVFGGTDQVDAFVLSELLQDCGSLESTSALFACESRLLLCVDVPE